MKKYVAIASIILVVGLALAIGWKEVYFSSEGFDFTFKNQTESETPVLFLSYKGTDGDIKIHPISPGGNSNVHINPLNISGESDMTLYYKDQKGQVHKETAIGYFEKGYFGTITVTAKSIDSTGKIEFEFTEKMFNF